MNVTLEYECDGGQQDPADFSSKVSSVSLDEGEFPSLWFGLTSDVTAVVAGTNTVTRTLVFLVLPSSPFQTADEVKDFFRGFYENKLALRVPSRVTALEPVIT